MRMSRGGTDLPSLPTRQLVNGWEESSLAQRKHSAAVLARFVGQGCRVQLDYVVIFGIVCSIIPLPCSWLGL